MSATSNLLHQVSDADSLPIFMIEVQSRGQPGGMHSICLWVGSSVVTNHYCGHKALSRVHDSTQAIRHSIVMTLLAPHTCVMC